jgi:hypothetical protein
VDGSSLLTFQYDEAAFSSSDSEHGVSNPTILRTKQQEQKSSFHYFSHYDRLRGARQLRQQRLKARGGAVFVEHEEKLMSGV